MNIQELIERSLYEKLRLKLVSLGYTPDITLYANTDAGYAAYKAALLAIKNSNKGFAVEVYGTGSIVSKGQVHTPRIVMDWGGFFEGEIGNSPEIESVKVGNVFHEMRSDLSTYEGIINFILVAETTAQERFIHDTFRQVLRSKSFITYYDSTPGSFLIIQDSLVKTSTPGDGLKEWIYTFNIPDINFNEITKVAETSPTILFNIQLALELGIITDPVTF